MEQVNRKVKKWRHSLNQCGRLNFLYGMHVYITIHNTEIQCRHNGYSEADLHKVKLKGDERERKKILVREKVIEDGMKRKRKRMRSADDHIAGRVAKRRRRRCRE
jgi:hypothetical protein